MDVISILHPRAADLLPHLPRPHYIISTHHRQYQCFILRVGGCGFCYVGNLPVFETRDLPQDSSRPPRTLAQLYGLVGHLWVNYIIAALGLVALLVV